MTTTAKVDTKRGLLFRDGRWRKPKSNEDAALYRSLVAGQAHGTEGRIKPMTTTNAKHTPGPWQYDNTRKHYTERDVIRRNGLIVCLLPSRGSMMPDAERDSNARLIAEAPAMAEALRDLLECAKWGNPFDFDKARAILARIDGEEGSSR
jgi:hypothetical protein